MKSRIIERFKFEAAHAVVIGGKPEEIHGHTFWLEVAVEGPLRNGYVMNFLELRRIVNEIIERLDHRNLNALFENPTTENVALWIAKEIEKRLPKDVRLQRIVLLEGEGNGVEFEF
ncbi:6-pyruvoyl-tetrahydropterin synthase [Thermococcus onnurineus NA1]|uniref:6-pyruvoyl-tetrahydropterin synthase n=1 Tax=Thermococcus onnurineus (strain NA1) TaxID=523850 RepID=B6YUN1_THEON|nr:6-carboxytetrahydropterin synthase [Thermococcus onnurineus]ACJ16067.1 6-pyruvoyl-tetrahydropterin synthase [Thermococcus onnurineus NA1]